VTSICLGEKAYDDEGRRGEESLKPPTKPHHIAKTHNPPPSQPNEEL
jgi:hypothetical protein